MSSSPATGRELIPLSIPCLWEMSPFPIQFLSHSNPIHFISSFFFSLLFFFFFFLLLSSFFFLLFLLITFEDLYGSDDPMLNPLHPMMQWMNVEVVIGGGGGGGGVVVIPMAFVAIPNPGISGSRCSDSQQLAIW